MHLRNEEHPRDMDQVRRRGALFGAKGEARLGKDRAGPADSQLPGPFLQEQLDVSHLSPALGLPGLIIPCFLILNQSSII